MNSVRSILMVVFLSFPAAAEAQQIFSDSFESSCITDSDNDRLPDCVESGSRVYVSQANTGTFADDADSDDDGMSDGDEVLGTLDGLNLNEIGANPLRKNIFLEIDWMDDSIDCTTHSHQPTQQSISRIQSAFANSPTTNVDGTRGIILVVDHGWSINLSGGNLISDSDSHIAGTVGGSDFTQKKNLNFNPNRIGYFHYMIISHTFGGSANGFVGEAELPGDDSIVAFQCYQDQHDPLSATIMHELGHNLRLFHGGLPRFDCNFKPNYNSIMNYNYSWLGVDTDCDPDLITNFELDYSRGERTSVNETSLIEEIGICNDPNKPTDFNHNGIVEFSSYSLDLNPNSPNQGTLCGSVLSILEDYDDWSNISYRAAVNSTGNSAPPELIQCGGGNGAPNEILYRE